MKFGGETPRWAILTFSLIFGLALIALPHIHRWTWDYGILKDLGIAVTIFTLLALTLDRWFRQDFAKDIFQAAIGHILEPELRDEIHWIAGFKWLAIKSRIQLKIEDLADGAVRATCTIERELKNISSKSESLAGKIAIDDWSIPGHQGEILECGAIGPDGICRNHQGTKKSPGGVLSAATEEIEVASGKTIRTFSRSVEYKHRNDSYSVVFNWPTRNPEVEIEISPTLEYDVGFSHRAGVIDESIINRRKTLQGTHLPHQSIGARWWPKIGQ